MMHLPIARFRVPVRKLDSRLVAATKDLRFSSDISLMIGKKGLSGCTSEDPPRQKFLEVDLIDILGKFQIDYRDKNLVLVPRQ